MKVRTRTTPLTRQPSSFSDDEAESVSPCHVPSLSIAHVAAIRGGRRELATTLKFGIAGVERLGTVPITRQPPHCKD